MEEPSSAPPSRKRSRAKDGVCQYVHKVTGERCTMGSFHTGLHSFDTVSVSSDINAWKNAWPRSLCLRFEGGADGPGGSEAQDDTEEIDSSLLGGYHQAPEIVNRRPVYEHESASSVLIFDRTNSWAVRRSAGSQIVLQLKDACRTPDLSKKTWQRVCTDGRLRNVVGLRCVLPAAPVEEAEEAPADAGAAASNVDAGLEAAALVAFIEENDDDDDDWWAEPLEAIVVGE